jgi:hypothetical protein
MDRMSLPTRPFAGTLPGASLVLAGASLLAWHAPNDPVRANDSVSWDTVTTRYASVRDYTCLYEKQERAISNGELQSIRLSFRKPFDVRMEWLDDRGQVDQIAVYRQGANDGKLLARRAGMLGSVVGTLRLDVRDRRAMADSRHPITEAGIGPLIDKIAHAIEQKQLEPLVVREESLDGVRAERQELVARSARPLPEIEGVSRVVVWIDLDVQLPLRVDLLDASLAMIERHRFKNVRLDAGLPDSLFTL